MPDESICPCGDAAETDDGQCRACAAIDQRIHDGSDVGDPCVFCGEEVDSERCVCVPIALKNYECGCIHGLDECVAPDSCTCHAPNCFVGKAAKPCDMCGVVGFCDCTAEDYIDACPECDSTGTVDDHACPVCLGHGIQRFKWLVEFTVTPNWVEDGFDLTDERALDMLHGDLEWAYPNELGAKVTRRPAAATIKRFQGYA